MSFRMDPLSEAKSIEDLKNSGKSIREPDTPTGGGFRNSKHYQPLMISIIAFGFVTFLAVQILYYLKVYLDVYHISSDALKVVQILFLVWNAVNDPLMGYMQDIGCCNMTWIMDRRKVILYAGPVFAVSFLIFWFPWSTSNSWISGLHLVVSLYLFDTLLTLVLSAYCGLLVEACKHHKQRVRCLVYSEVFEFLGASIITPLNYLSNELRDFAKFQIGCVVVTIVGAACMMFGAYNLPQSIDRSDVKEEIQLAKVDGEPATEVEEATYKKALKVSWQIIKEPRFICLLGSQFFRTMRHVFLSQFLIIIVEALVSRAGFLPMGSGALSIFYASIRASGMILFTLLWWPTAKLGTHVMIIILSVLSILNVVVALILGRDDVRVVAIFIAIEMTLGMCGMHSYYMLLGGEVIDTDAKEHNRASPLSTLIFTLKALFTKPSEQLAPFFFLILLDRGGYSMYKAECIPSVNMAATTMSPLLNSTLSTTTTTMSSEMIYHCLELKDAMYSSMVLFTLLCIGGELIFIAVDYWYKKRVLNMRGRNGSQIEPAPAHA